MPRPNMEELVGDTFRLERRHEGRMLLGTIHNDGTDQGDLAISDPSGVRARKSHSSPVCVRVR